MTNIEDLSWKITKKLCKAISNNTPHNLVWVRKPSVKITSNNKQFLGIFIARVFIPWLFYFLKKTFSLSNRKK